MKLPTVFYHKHLESGAQIVEEANWQLAAVYSSIKEEYSMVRERAGFVDFSFQGGIAVAGSGAFDFLQKMIVNDLRKIAPGKALYSTMVDETGKVIADTVVLWVEEKLFVVNAGLFTTNQAIAWLKKYAVDYEVSVMPRSTCLLALQGPKSRDILQKAVDIQDLAYFDLKETKLGEIPVLIARVGFSGELGYELHTYPEYAHNLWDTLIELGKEYDARPYGLDATGVLVVEKGYLQSADFYEGSTPLEIGLEWTIGFEKDDFIGKTALLKRKSEGLKTKLMGFEMSDSSVVATGGDKLFDKNGQPVGQVTYGAYGPAVEKSIARGWIDNKHANEGEILQLGHEGKKYEVKVTQFKWYDPQNKIING